MFLMLLLLTVITLSFMCSIFEFSTLSTNASFISSLKKKNESHANLLKKLKTNIDRTIFSILFFNRLVLILGSIIIGVYAQGIFPNLESNCVLFASFFLIFLFSFIARIIAKFIAKANWKSIISFSIRLINFLVILATPAIFINEFFLQKNKNEKKINEMVSREALIDSTLLSEEEGLIGDFESDTIKNTLSLRNRKVKDILTPRSVIYAIQKDKKIKDILEDKRTFKFSRVPVYADSIDQIVGVVLTKKIFKHAIKNKDASIESIMFPIFTVNENVPVSNALDSFIKKKEHMFLVLDSYDQTEGIVTLEDCIETLLGMEIMDESDTVDDMQKLAYEKKTKLKEKIKSA